MSTGVVGRAAMATSDGPLDLVNGLPAHPLVVHGAVVLVPLAALGVIAMAIWPRFSQRSGWLVVGASVVAAGASVAAKESGEALAERVGEPRFDHAELAEFMPAFAVALMVVTVALWWIDRRGAVAAARRGWRFAVAIVAMLVAVGSIVWVVRVGDSGAKSTWSGVVAAGTPTAAPAA